MAFPAALGIASPHDVWSELEHGLGRPVFEVPTLPPSVPGMRVFAVLRDALRRAGGSLLLNNVVVGAEHDQRPRQHVARPGRAARGAPRRRLDRDRDGRVRQRRARARLRLDGARDGARAAGRGRARSRARARFEPQYFAAHPIARAGVAVDDRLRPVGARRAGFENVLVAGATLAGAEPWKEKSGDGLSLSTGHMAAELVLAESGATQEAIA